MTINELPSAKLLEGKVAVITGGGGVIGQVVAATFVREGARVLVADWNGAERWVAAELGAAAVPLHVDVTKEDEIEKMFAPAVAEFGCVDVSVHLAGPNGARRAAEMSQDEFQQILSAHLGGMSMCTKHAIRAMASNGGGAILNFSSVASLNYSPWISIAYSAAKAGINSMTRSYAAEYMAPKV